MPQPIGIIVQSPNSSSAESSGRLPLPVDEIVNDVVTAFASHKVILLQATPGSGKTTRIPPAIMEALRALPADAGVARHVVVLEPRRLAARLSAERVASERGEEVGESVGYRVRFLAKVSSATRLTFVTEGLLLRQLVNDPLLAGVGCVILDEFHERHLHTDLALSLLTLLQRTLRPDLKIIVMSATLEVETLARHFPEAARIDLQTRKYPIQVSYAPASKEKKLCEQVADAVRRSLADSRLSGHILVFLPGAAEIRRAAQALIGVERDFGVLICELRGESSPQDQRKVFQRSDERKVILATNVAETSITIDGVGMVIDSGLAKMPGFAPWSGMPTLDLVKVSQASCAQRAGRAGRTGPGFCVRLYSEQDFLSRPVFEKPEILRLDLTQTVLEVAALIERIKAASKDATQNKGSRWQSIDWNSLCWLDHPDEGKLTAAKRLLMWLRALSGDGEITELGKNMAKYPLHPRLSVVVASANENLRSIVPWIVAILAESRAMRRHQFQDDHSGSDILSFLKSMTSHERDVVAETAKQVARLGGLEPLMNFSEVLRQPLNAEDISRLVFPGFPDRVAKRRLVANSRDYNLCLGGGTVLDSQSAARDSDWILCLEAEDSLGGDASNSAITRLATAIDPIDILDGPADLVSQKVELVWDKVTEKVRSFDRVLYGGLVIEERQVIPEPSAAQTVLFEALRAVWPKPFLDDEWLRSYRVRAQLANNLAFDPAGTGGLNTLLGEDFIEFLKGICADRISFEEIVAVSLRDHVATHLGWDKLQALDDLMPESVLIGQGRRVAVHYEIDKTPWIESRLQDFFGCSDTPAIGRGKVPLVVHLLAPNKRAVQVTRDLQSFWKNSYPVLRRELSRNYPKHLWPEDPLTAEPPPPNRIR